MSDDQLHEELKTKKRALGEIRLQLARYGIGAPINLVLDEQDLVKEIRAIEQELGLSPTPTIRERRGGSTGVARRYEAPAVDHERVTRERLTRQRQGDIDHQITLLGIHRRNMQHFRNQARAHGGVALAPLVTQNGIEEQRGAIARIKDILRGYGVEVEDLAGDE